MGEESDNMHCLALRECVKEWNSLAQTAAEGVRLSNLLAAIISSNEDAPKEQRIAHSVYYVIT